MVKMAIFKFQLFLTFFALVLFSGCSKTVQVRDYGTFNPKVERASLYVIPFNTTLVPPEVGEPIFNDFVDYLNQNKKKTAVANFMILKEELKEVEPAWLVKQSYISGDIWGYVESSGCCSTEIKVKSRIYLYEAGKTAPSIEILLPVEDFFEHDKMPKNSAKTRLGKKLAKALADEIIKKLSR